MAKNDRSSINIFPEVLIAQRISKKFGLAPGFDIHSFTEQFITLQEDSIPFSIDALFLGLEKQNEKPTILLNSNTYYRRQRFTLAHELGHFFIPWHAGIIICHIDESDNDFNDYIYREMEGEANRFASELLMPTKWLKSLISSNKSITDIINMIHDTGTSYTSGNISLSKILPAGYLFVEVDANDFVEYSGRTKGTVASAPMKGEKFNPEHYRRISSKHEIIRNSFYTTHWFKLKETVELQDNDRDQRESKEIIRELLSDIEPNIKKRQHLLQSINGVIGAANSIRIAKNESELLSYFHQRFASKNDLRFLLSDDLFKLFLDKKAREIIQKNV